MTNIIVSVLSIIIGLVGVFINKRSKYRDGGGFSAEVKFYFLFYGLVAAGIFSLFIEIKNKSLYPCAEGTGYAGGITSAAIDDEKCAIKCVEVCFKYESLNVKFRFFC